MRREVFKRAMANARNELRTPQDRRDTAYLFLGGGASITPFLIGLGAMTDAKAAVATLASALVVTEIVTPIVVYSKARREINANNSTNANLAVT